MKKLLLIALFFASCQTPKSDEVKIKEMDEQFEKSMEQDTYCYFDTLQKLQAEDVSIAVQCFYDKINGVKKIEKHSSGAGYNFYQQISFLNGNVYKDWTEMIPDSVTSENKHVTSLYYVVDGKIVSKTYPALFIEKTALFRVHWADSLAKKHEERLNLK